MCVYSAATNSNSKTGCRGCLAFTKTLAMSCDMNSGCSIHVPADQLKNVCFYNCTELCFCNWGEIDSGSESPSGNQTWQWKIHHEWRFELENLCTWSIFHRHVSLPEGMFHVQISEKFVCLVCICVCRQGLSTAHPLTRNVGVCAQSHLLLL